MNNKVEIIYDKSLTLLRNIIWQKFSPICINESEWKNIHHFAIEQALSGLVPDSFLYLTKESLPTKSIKIQMIAMQLQVEQNNEHVNDELLKFVDELLRRNIIYVLIKGQGVASIYPNPLHRVSGDIDLYIPKEYYHAANNAILTYGGKRTHETRMHVDYIVNDVVWELHHGIYYFQKDMRNIIFNNLIKEAMAEPPVFASIGNGKVRILPATMNLLLLLAHILDHFYCEGIGLRQLCDLTLFLDREFSNINKEKLLSGLKNLSMTSTYRVFGALCVKHLGLPSDKLMLSPTIKDEKLADAIMNDCLKGGNFGRSDHPGRDTAWDWLRYYFRFIWRLVKFRNLCPSEARWWPLAKLYRLFTGTIFINEEKSILNKMQ